MNISRAISSNLRIVWHWLCDWWKTRPFRWCGWHQACVVCCNPDKNLFIFIKKTPSQTPPERHCLATPFTEHVHETWKTIDSTTRTHYEYAVLLFCCLLIRNFWIKYKSFMIGGLSVFEKLITYYFQHHLFFIRAPSFKWFRTPFGCADFTRTAYRKSHFIDRFSIWWLCHSSHSYGNFNINRTSEI